MNPEAGSLKIPAKGHLQIFNCIDTSRLLCLINRVSPTTLRVNTASTIAFLALGTGHWAGVVLRFRTTRKHPLHPGHHLVHWRCRDLSSGPNGEELNGSIIPTVSEPLSRERGGGALGSLLDSADREPLCLKKNYPLW